MGYDIILLVNYVYQCLKSLIFRIYVDCYRVRLLGWGCLEIFIVDRCSTSTLRNVEVFVEIRLRCVGHFRLWPCFNIFLIRGFLSLLNQRRWNHMVWSLWVKLSRIFWLVELGISLWNLFVCHLSGSVLFEWIRFNFSMRGHVSIWLEGLHDVEYLLRSVLGLLGEVYLLLIILNIEIAAIVASEIVVKHLQINLQELRRVILHEHRVNWLLIVLVIFSLLSLTIVIHLAGKFIGWFRFYDALSTLWRRHYPGSRWLVLRVFWNECSIYIWNWFVVTWNAVFGGTSMRVLARRVDISLRSHRWDVGWALNSGDFGRWHDHFVDCINAFNAIDWLVVHCSMRQQI